MPLILGTNSIKDTGYDVANSCRFDDGSSDYLERTASSAGNRRTLTISYWLKRSNITTSNSQGVLNAGILTDGNNHSFCGFQFNTDTAIIQTTTSNSNVMSLQTTALFRDVSAWYNFVWKVDTTQGTESNRVKLYVNGVEHSLTGTFPSQNQDTWFNYNNKHQVGTRFANYLNGYLTEMILIDGQALDPTSFGEFDSDSPTIWKPIDVSGLTFGTNGFYLDFENASSLGADVSGNSNNFTVNNLTSVDQSTDTCTNNFCTMNPLDNYFSGATFSEGNLKFVHGSSAWNYNTATFGLSSGKWYWEMKCVDAGSGGAGSQPTVGIANDPPTESGNYLGKDAYAWGYRAYQQNVVNNGSQVLGSLSTFTDDDIIGVYMDLDNNKLYFSKNGTLQNSTGISLTAPASTTTGFYFPAAGDNKDSASSTWEANFGSPSFSISSGNTDDNGYGNFEYSPNITGDSTAKKFYACNTKNLAEFG